MTDPGDTGFLALLNPPSIIHCWHYDILLPKQITSARHLQWSRPMYALLSWHLW